MGNCTSAGGGASGGKEILSLSFSEKINYDSIKQDLNSLEFRYNVNNMAEMRRAANAFNNTYNEDDLKDSGFYGKGGAIALRNYRDQLQSDYMKAQKKIQSAVKKYENSKSKSGKAKYDDAKAKLDAEKRKKAFFSQF